MSSGKAGPIWKAERSNGGAKGTWLLETAHGGTTLFRATVKQAVERWERAEGARLYRCEPWAVSRAGVTPKQLKKALARGEAAPKPLVEKRKASPSAKMVSAARKYATSHV